MSSSPDLQPWTYKFGYSYYDNFLANRKQQFATSGDFYSMWEGGWNAIDSTKVISDGFGPAVSVNNGIQVAGYVQKTFNGDMPECLTDKLANALKDAAAFLNDLVNAAFDAISGFFSDLFGSFICTATLEVVGHECGIKLLGKLKEYRDIRMEDSEIRDMYRHYTVLGPRIVRFIADDDDSAVVYKYLYAEYISKIVILIEEKEDYKVLEVYFQMVTDMVNRYDIPVSRRFTEWQKNWM